jgi:hypothetical protein
MAYTVMPKIYCYITRIMSYPPMMKKGQRELAFSVGGV